MNPWSNPERIAVKKMFDAVPVPVLKEKLLSMCSCTVTADDAGNREKIADKALMRAGFEEAIDKLFLITKISESQGESAGYQDMSK